MTPGVRPKCFLKTREVALISAPEFGCYFGKSAFANCKQLRRTQYTLFPKVFSKRRVEMQRESATKINRVNTHFRGHVI